MEIEIFVCEVLYFTENFTKNFLQENFLKPLDLEYTSGFIL